MMAPPRAGSDHHRTATTEIAATFLNLCLWILVVFADIVGCLIFHLSSHFDLEVPNCCLCPASHNQRHRFCHRVYRSLRESHRKSGIIEHSADAADGVSFRTDCAELPGNTGDDNPRYCIGDQTNAFKPQRPNCNASSNFEAQDMESIVLTGDIPQVSSQIMHQGNDFSSNSMKSCNRLQTRRDATDSDTESSAHVDPFPNDAELSLMVAPDDIRDDSESISICKSSLRIGLMDAWGNCRDVSCAETGSSNPKKAPHIENEPSSADYSEKEIMSIVKKMHICSQAMAAQNEGQGRNSTTLMSRAVQRIGWKGKSSMGTSFPPYSSKREMRKKRTQMETETESNHSDQVSHEEDEIYDGGDAQLEEALMVADTESNHSDEFSHDEDDTYGGKIMAKRCAAMDEGLRAERDALYDELEKERQAATIAANEAVAMISRLQQEKALVEMECAHYHRLLEEKAIYDQQDMVILKEFLLKREKENQALEQEVDLRRQKCVREKVERMKRLGMPRQGNVTSEQRKNDVVMGQHFTPSVKDFNNASFHPQL